MNWPGPGCVCHPGPGRVPRPHGVTGVGFLLSAYVLTPVHARARGKLPVSLRFFHPKFSWEIGDPATPRATEPSPHQPAHHLSTAASSRCLFFQLPHAPHTAAFKAHLPRAARPRLISSSSSPAATSQAIASTTIAARRRLLELGFFLPLSLSPLTKKGRRGHGGIGAVRAVAVELERRPRRLLGVAARPRLRAAAAAPAAGPGDVRRRRRRDPRQGVRRRLVQAGGARAAAAPVPRAHAPPRRGQAPPPQAGAAAGTRRGGRPALRRRQAARPDGAEPAAQLRTPATARRWSVLAFLDTSACSRAHHPSTSSSLVLAFRVHFLGARKGLTMEDRCLLHQHGNNNIDRIACIG